MISEQLESGCKALGVHLSSEANTALTTYAQELVRWSRRINLIGKKQSVSEIIESHYIDSLSLSPWLADPWCRLLDVGTGGGFPGLVCKIANPGLRVGLVEPRQKRVSFLRHIVRTLHCRDVEVFPRRLEEVATEIQGYTTFTSRAVTEIGLFLKMVQPFLRRGNRVICMKGPQYRKELQGAQAIIEKFKLTLDQIEEFTLPVSGSRRCLLLFTKQEE